MKKLAFLLIAILFLPACSTAVPQSAKDAHEALKKLEARTQVGITYPEYLKAVGDTKYLVQKFLETKDADNHPNIANAHKKTMLNYELAAAVWQSRFTPVRGIELMSEQGISIREYLGKRHEWPSLIIEQSQAGALEILDPQKLLSLIWTKASKELAAATELIEGNK
jgi:hypothetical protein